MLNTYVNKQKNFWLCPGQCNLYFLPDKMQMFSGAKGRIVDTNQHPAQTCSCHPILNHIKSHDIKELNKLAKVNGLNYTLHFVLMDLTFSLIPDDVTKAR